MLPNILTRRPGASILEMLGEDADGYAIAVLDLTDLVQDKPLGWCALTEVQVWGREAALHAAE